MEKLRVAAGLVASAKLVEAILTPQTIDAAEMCRVGQNIKAVTFKDKFPITGQGRPHIYDGPTVDQEVGPATGFVVYAITKDGKSLGQVAVGPTGQAKILNIEQPCNTKGPNGKPALEWTYYTEQNPSHKVAAIAENGFAANTVIGRELKQDPRPTQTSVPATRTPIATPTLTSVPSSTPDRRAPTVTPAPTPPPGDTEIPPRGSLPWIAGGLGLGAVLGTIGGFFLGRRGRNAIIAERDQVIDQRDVAYETLEESMTEIEQAHTDLGVAVTDRDNAIATRDLVADTAVDLQAERELALDQHDAVAANLAVVEGALDTALDERNDLLITAADQGHRLIGIDTQFAGIEAELTTGNRPRRTILQPFIAAIRALLP